jgi:hypothetical protein
MSSPVYVRRPYNPYNLRATIGASLVGATFVAFVIHFVCLASPRLNQWQPVNADGSAPTQAELQPAPVAPAPGAK